jgi:hypothetical protein
VLLGSKVQRIAPESVLLEMHGKPLVLPNDVVIVSAGGILPTDFLRSAGIVVATKFGTA